MYPYYYNSFGYDSGDLVGAVAVVLVIWLVAMLFSFAYSIFVYVLHSLGLYTVAKRRGIHNPWLSWIPVASTWILGSISDQYQYVAKGKVRNRRKVLLGLEIAMYVLLIAFLICYFVMLFRMIGYAYTISDMNPQMISSLLGFAGVYLAMFAVAIVAAVFQYIAYYDLFASCNPDHAVMFLILSIFMNFLLPYFVFACRKKDLGMPAQKSCVNEPAPEPEIIDGEIVETNVVEAQEEDFEA